MVDDASKDETVATVRREYPWVELIEAPKNLGFSGAVNLGAEAAHGDVILLLNNDTTVPEGSLEELLEAMVLYPKYGILGARLVHKDGTPQWSGGPRLGLWQLFLRATGWFEGGPSRELPLEGAPYDFYWVTGAAMAIRREVWEEAGPMNEGYRHYCQDLEFCEKVKESETSRWKIGALPSFVVEHKQGGSIQQDGGTGLKLDAEKLLPDYVEWACRAGSSFARHASWVLKLGTLFRLRRNGRAEYRQAAKSLKYFPSCPSRSGETTDA